MKKVLVTSLLASSVWANVSLPIASRAAAQTVSTPQPTATIAPTASKLELLSAGAQPQREVKYPNLLREVGASNQGFRDGLIRLRDLPFHPPPPPHEQAHTLVLCSVTSQKSAFRRPKFCSSQLHIL